MELKDIKPSEITFKEKLFTSDHSVIFLVEIRNLTCVMKVHHGRGPRKYYEPARELDIHVLETTAYRRLQEHGLSDRGIIPHFYGVIEKFDPSLCLPHLRRFVNDEYPPNAILLEYIPNLEKVELDNYTEKRAKKLIEAIQEIHKALVLHNDPRPRNMMVFKDDPEKVMWMDFDRAETYHKAQITERQKSFLEQESRIVGEFKMCMDADVAKGKLDEAYVFYSS